MRLHDCVMRRTSGGTEYTYDAAGNQTSKTETVANTARGTTTYQYDALNRLETVTEPGGKTTEYTYDAAGNRTSENVTESSITTTTSYTYNAQNRLICTTQNGNTAPYFYDYNGNMLYNDVELSGYDMFNRMIYAAGATYAYNGEGKRVSKTVGNVTTRYLYEGDQVILEKDSGGNIIRNVHGANLISRSIVQKQSTTISEKHVMEIRYDNTAFYQYNGRGDVTRLSDFNGNSEEYTYDAFGNQLSKTTNGEVGNNPFRYAGYMYDEESEYYYLNARYYDPKTARFLSEDAPGYGNRSDPLSLNLYTYCHNEPIMHVDPSGHIPASLDENGNSTVPGWLDWDGDGYVDTKEDKARFDKDGDRIADWNQGKGTVEDYRPGGKYSANPPEAAETDNLPLDTNKVAGNYAESISKKMLKAEPMSIWQQKRLTSAEYDSLWKIVDNEGLSYETRLEAAKKIGLDKSEFDYILELKLLWRFYQKMGHYTGMTQIHDEVKEIREQYTKSAFYDYSYGTEYSTLDIVGKDTLKTGKFMKTALKISRNNGYAGLIRIKYERTQSKGELYHVEIKEIFVKFFDAGREKAKNAARITIAYANGVPVPENIIQVASHKNISSFILRANDLAYETKHYQEAPATATKGRTFGAEFSYTDIDGKEHSVDPLVSSTPINLTDYDTSPIDYIKRNILFL